MVGDPVVGQSVHVHVEEAGVLQRDLDDHVIVQVVPVRRGEPVRPELDIHAEIRGPSRLIHGVLAGRPVRPVRIGEVFPCRVGCARKRRLVCELREVGVICRPAVRRRDRKETRVRARRSAVPRGVGIVDEYPCILIPVRGYGKRRWVVCRGCGPGTVKIPHPDKCAHPERSGR